jgi:hypothetical protein
MARGAKYLLFSHSSQHRRSYIASGMTLMERLAEYEREYEFLRLHTFPEEDRHRGDMGWRIPLVPVA